MGWPGSLGGATALMLGKTMRAIGRPRETLEDHEIQRLVQHPNSEFWKQNPHQNLCSRNLPATPPQQNLVSGMLLVCNRILQNMWLSMTNIGSMTEHGVLFCNISDLFPQRKSLWNFFSRNYPATTVSQILSRFCPLATDLRHATNNDRGQT